MKRIACFEKVGRSRFLTDASDFGGAEEAYGEIKKPVRATSGSAGYDIFTPFSVELAPGASVKIPTGIRARIDDGWALKIYPRSGLGFRYRLQLDNTVGIIDSDYYYSDNEGHIQVKVTNDSREGKTLSLQRGTAFCQGIFVEYGITTDDDATDVRNGGFGSTGNC